MRKTGREKKREEKNKIQIGGQMIYSQSTPEGERRGEKKGRTARKERKKGEVNEEVKVH